MKKSSKEIKDMTARLLRDPNKRIILVLTVLVMVFAGYTIKVSSDKQQLEEQVASLKSQNSQPADNQEALQLKQEVGQFLELPDETPTIATVVDADKVRNQPFFKNAQNGDKVLIFANNGRAILYRPSSKKVIEVAPINLGQNQTSQPADTVNE